MDITTIKIPDLPKSVPLANADLELTTFVLGASLKLQDAILRMSLAVGVESKADTATLLFNSIAKSVREGDFELARSKTEVEKEAAIAILRTFLLGEE